MLFVGIDLAWSERNKTGVAIVEGNEKRAKLKSIAILCSDEEIISFLKDKVKDKEALIAIDGPLIVPNKTGRRVAEKIVGMLFRKYNAGAHPANRKRLSFFGGKIRGEEISKLLEKERFIHDPYIKRFEKTRKFFEVYPHPATIVIFNLNKIIQYKAKPKRNYEFRWSEFKRYQNYLKNLEKQHPKLILPKEIIEVDVKKLKAQKLKDYEDKLDAILCAYIAYYYWVNPDKCAILGNMREGYILTPIFDFMKKKLESINSQTKLSTFSSRTALQLKSFALPLREI